MKTKFISTCLAVLLPLPALAHPGHDFGVVDAVAAKLSSGPVAGLVVFVAAGLAAAAIGFYRKRASARADG